MLTLQAQALGSSTSNMAEKIENPIYLITDGSSQLKNSKLIETTEKIFANHAKYIFALQFREGKTPESQKEKERFFFVADELSKLCKTYNVSFVVNRNREVFERTEADGIHLGRDAKDVSGFKKTSRKKLLFGYSAHSVQEAEEALLSDFDYVFLSPIFQPISKPEVSHPLGLAPLKELSERTQKLVFALGGISESNFSEVLQAKASGAAFIGALYQAKSPENSIKRLIEQSQTKTPV